jgi:hypothetical protein
MEGGYSSEISPNFCQTVWHHDFDKEGLSEGQQKCNADVAANKNIRPPVRNETPV